VLLVQGRVGSHGPNSPLPATHAISTVAAPVVGSFFPVFSISTTLAARHDDYTKTVVCAYYNSLELNLSVSPTWLPLINFKGVSCMGAPYIQRRDAE
jgi:hypothetical protein